MENVSPAEYAPEIFKFLICPVSTFSVISAGRYLLEIKENWQDKFNRFRMISMHVNSDITKLKCGVENLNNKLRCNIVQAYILKTEDAPELAEHMTEYMIKELKVKPNDEIQTEQERMRFKKYILNNKKDLSRQTLALYEKFSNYFKLF